MEFLFQLIIAYRCFTRYRCAQSLLTEAARVYGLQFALMTELDIFFSLFLNRRILLAISNKPILSDTEFATFLANQVSDVKKSLKDLNAKKNIIYFNDPSSDSERDELSSLILKKATSSYTIDRKEKGKLSHFFHLVSLYRLWEMWSIVGKPLSLWMYYYALIVFQVAMC